MKGERRDGRFRERHVSAAGPGDEQLRRRFAGLRQEDERRAPPFADLWRSRQRKPERRIRGVFATGAAAIVFAGLFWLWAVRPRPVTPMVASITSWKAPTDFLLETPGRDLLRTVPEIGGWSGFTQASRPEATPSPAGKAIDLHHDHGGRK